MVGIAVCVFPRLSVFWKWILWICKRLWRPGIDSDSLCIPGYHTSPPGRELILELLNRFTNTGSDPFPSLQVLMPQRWAVTDCYYHPTNTQRHSTSTADFLFKFYLPKFILRSSLFRYKSPSPASHELTSRLAASTNTSTNSLRRRVQSPNRRDFKDFSSHRDFRSPQRRWKFLLFDSNFIVVAQIGGKSDEGKSRLCNSCPYSVDTYT